MCFGNYDARQSCCDDKQQQLAVQHHRHLQQYNMQTTCLAMCCPVHAMCFPFLLVLILLATESWACFRGACRKVLAQTVVVFPCTQDSRGTQQVHCCSLENSVGIASSMWSCRGHSQVLRLRYSCCVAGTPVKKSHQLAGPGGQVMQLTRLVL